VQRRLISLDVLRGLTVMGMILVNSTELLKEVHELKVLPWLLHSRWAGVKIADLVFPAFVMMVGVSIPLALRSAKTAAGLTGFQVRHIVWRTLRLIALGLILTNLDWCMAFSEPWRWWGVLQRIGLVYGVCAVLFVRCGARTLAGIAGGLLLLYWPLVLLPALDGVPTDLWQPGHNFAASIDRGMMGSLENLWVPGPAGYDPEGLLGTLPAIAQGLIGVLIGEYLLARPDRKTNRPLAVAGAAMLAAGLAWGCLFPLVKDLWSSSFVLATSGITTLALAGLSALLDHGPQPVGRRAFPIRIAQAFGLNAVAAYVLHEVNIAMLGWALIQTPVAWAQPIIGERAAALIPALLVLTFIWVCMDYLWRKNWVIKI
jgi:predicted acyltransferase